MKGVCPDNRIPKTLLGSLKDCNLFYIINIAKGAFNNAKMADSINEKRPETS